MALQRNQTHKLRQNVTTIALFTLLFAIAYAQSPLYTSNQNQYFLHGLARAGLGYLENDWLANTLDPTPVFSALVETTYRLIQYTPLFYIFYACLMGIYLFSLLGIARKLFIPASEAQANLTLILLAGLLIVFHSAALRFLLSKILSANWTYIFEDGVADQRILGPVFQPSAFGVLLIASIYLFLNQKPYQAVFSAVLAATIHPTYLLSAAVLTTTYMLLTRIQDKNISRVLFIGIFALILVAPTLTYVFKSFGGSSTAAATQAREILVSYRIPHHARVSEWLDATVAVKILITLAALYLSRRSLGLFAILIGSSLIAFLLTVIQSMLGNNPLALIFPWRLSIYILPLSTSIVLAAIAYWITTSSLFTKRKWENILKIISGTAVLFVVLIGAIRFKLDLERKTRSPERALFSYVNDHKQANDLYLTPVKMQDFRLESGAPVFVDFKSIPYKDSDVLEWYRRVQLADDFYQRLDCKLLKKMVAEEGITHVVVEMDQKPSLCSFMESTFQDQNLALWQIDQSELQQVGSGN
ncbi:MAG TPA: DUF6798 domain-containing protein [Anaerolineales bacterium]|nr:DUF6798 domain-containing protein [Anaerolineales bacterium]